MIKIYGSPLCPDCVACKANFDADGIAYEFCSVTDSLKNLKDFLALRDSLPIFDEAKASHHIGIPTLVLADGTVTMDWERVVRDLGHEVLPKKALDSKPEAHACSLDGKGC